jgi:hypothetical protein
MQIRIVASAAVLLAFVAACSTGIRPGSLPPSASAEIDGLQQAPAQAGERIYEGQVYSRDTTRGAPLFRYDRRVRATPSGFVTTHLTHAADGGVIVTQVASHDSLYRVSSANMIQRQSGLAGSVEALAGDSLRFTLLKDGKPSMRIEGAGAPLVAGPTMFGFIVVNWAALERGEKVPMRYTVLESNRSYTFDLELTSRSADSTVIRMLPSSWILKRIVGPTYFYFDPRTRKVTGYDGQVPPLETVDGKLRSLTARVRYTHHSAAFR